MTVPPLDQALNNYRATMQARNQEALIPDDFQPNNSNTWRLPNGWLIKSRNNLVLLPDVGSIEHIPLNVAEIGGRIENFITDESSPDERRDFESRLTQYLGGDFDEYGEAVRDSAESFISRESGNYPYIRQLLFFHLNRMQRAQPSDPRYTSQPRE